MTKIQNFSAAYFYLSCSLVLAATVTLFANPAGIGYHLLACQYIWGASAGLLSALIVYARPRYGSWMVGVAMLAPLLLLGHTANALVVLFQWVAIFALGSLLDRISTLTVTSVVKALIVGYVAHSLTIVVLVYTGFLTPAILMCLNLCAIGAAIILRPRPLSLPTSHQPINGRFRSISDALVVGLSVALFVILSIMAAVPENGSDAVVAYRPMIMQIMATGKLNFDPKMTSIGLLSIPQIWQQAAIAVLSSDFGAAKIWNYSLICASFALSAITARCMLGVGRISDMSAILPGLLAATVPTIAMVTLSAFPDAAAFLAVQMLAFWVWYVVEKVQLFERGKPILACQTGALLALVYLEKFVLASVIAPLMVACGVHILVRYKSRSALRFIVVAALVALTIVLAWHGFVYAETGNPFFPYYDQIWDSPFATTMELPMQGYSSLTLPWDMTVRSTTYSPVVSFDGSLGLTFLIGALITIYIVARATIRRDVAASAWTSSAVFLIGMFTIPLVLNNDRYVIPLLALLTLPVAEITKTFRSRQFFAISLAACAVNLALMPRYGYGSGRPELDPRKLAYSQVYNHKLDRQRVADTLSRRYGSEGRILDLSSAATSIGTTFDSSWYRMPAKSELQAYQSKGPMWIRSFVKDKKIDAVTLNHSSNVETIAALTEIAKDVDQMGTYLIFYIKDSIRFDRFYTAKKNGQLLLMSPIGSGTYEWQITYRCKTPGLILLVKVNPTWRYDSNMPICDDREETYTSPLMTWKDDIVSQIFLRGFGPDLTIVRSGVWYRPPLRH